MFPLIITRCAPSCFLLLLGSVSTGWFMLNFFSLKTFSEIVARRRGQLHESREQKVFEDKDANVSERREDFSQIMEVGS